jgi:hypothetical protein
VPAGEADGGAPVGLLARDVDELAGLAAAGPEVAVVEDQHRQAGLGEPLGVVEQPVHGAAEAMSHDHTRQRSCVLGCRPVEVAGQGDAVRFEGHLLAIHLLVHERPPHGQTTDGPRRSVFVLPARYGGTRARGITRKRDNRWDLHARPALQ